MKAIEIIAIVVILALLSFWLCGCSEEQRLPDVKPLSGYLIPTRQDWKDTYGDTPETQTAFNLAVIRYDQKQIFNLIQQYHPPNDPNVIKEGTVRWDYEDSGVIEIYAGNKWVGRPNDPNVIKEGTVIEKLRVHKDADSTYGWRLDMNNKINEIIDRINNLNDL
ncbi:hypothetical protein LCGC14_1345970 [marine sediment metagenome]|uniref:Lipoprotein n=1 Tax=marine sediment metagenome TaxID=412755 RepID=A0A0F9KYG3_9ZZZZ